MPMCRCEVVDSPERLRWRIRPSERLKPARNGLERLKGQIPALRAEVRRSSLEAQPGRWLERGDTL
jgi:hypothetical protein